MSTSGSVGRAQTVPALPRESINNPGWDGRTARGVRHRELIEASLDRAEAYERLGDFEPA